MYSFIREKSTYIFHQRAKHHFHNNQKIFHPRKAETSIYKFGDSNEMYDEMKQVYRQ